MTQYLILHKVCGQPMWDMAEKIELGDEEGWITTSGHRCYPFRVIGSVDQLDGVTVWADPIPDDWPDYSPEIDHSQPAVTFDMGKLLSALIPQPQGKRRL